MKAEKLLRPPAGHTLRFDRLIIYPALDAQRESLGMTWRDVARALTRFNEGMFRRVAAGQQIGWPHGMASSSGWMEPAASFTRAYENPPARVSVNKAAKQLLISVDDLDRLLRGAGITPGEFGGQYPITQDELDRVTD